MLEYVGFFVGVGALGAVILYVESVRCKHDWQTIDTAVLKWNGTIVGKTYIQQCNRCKKMRQFKFE